MEFLICNRMVRAFYSDGMPNDDGLGYALVHRMGLRFLAQNEKCKGLHPIPLRTFVSRKFVCKAMTAEEAIENNFISWRNEFTEQISYLVDAIRTLNKEKAKHLLPHTAISSFPVFWILIHGAEEKIGCEQFNGNIDLVAFRPIQQDITEESGEQLKSLLQFNARPPIHDSTLALAITFSHFGYYDLAIIQVCTACETLLSKILKQHLINNRGCSKSSLDQYFEDETFSHLLNLHLPSIFDLSTINDYRKIIGDINWARKRRNEIVHRGKSSLELKADRIKEVIGSAEILVNKLTEVCKTIEEV